MATLHVTEDQFDWLIAALRLYMQHLDGHTEHTAAHVQKIATNEDQHDPPTSQDIDALANGLLEG